MARPIMENVRAKTKRPSVRGQDATEAAQQITTYVPVSVHKRMKCHAIANDTSLNALMLDWIEAGLKAARA